MQAKLLPIAGAALLMLAACERPSTNNASGEEVIKIGHVGPLSGPSAHLGKDNENGARMAIEALNAKGIIIGGKKARFELMAEDDGSDPKQATAIAQRFVDAKVKGVIGHLNSGTSVPASKIYYQAGIPQISPATTRYDYTHQGFNTTFRVVTNDNQIGGVLGRFAVDTGKAKRIAVIDDRTAYGQGVATEFIKGAKAQDPNVEIVANEYTNDKATDFTAILTTIKAKNPDLIFFGGMDSVGGPMLRQVRHLGMDTKFMGGDGICTESMIRLAGDALGNGQVVCAEAGGLPEAEAQKLNEFKAAFKKKFGVDVQIYAPYDYDGLMAMGSAMEQAGSSDPAKYLPVLAKIRHKGVTGEIAFDENGDLLNGTLSMYTFKDGKRELMAVVK